MAEHQHNDRFDEFLKNSFDNYSESPPDSVWEGIDAAFSGSRIPFWRRHWWLGLIGLVLLGTLFYQHFYYQKKLNQLEQKLLESSEKAVASTSTDSASQSVASSADELAGDAVQSGVSERGFISPDNKLGGQSNARWYEMGAGGMMDTVTQRPAWPKAKLPYQTAALPGNATANATTESQPSASAIDEAPTARPTVQLVAIAPLRLLLHPGALPHVDLHLRASQMAPAPGNLWAGALAGMYSTQRKFKQASTLGHHHGGGFPHHFVYQSNMSGYSTSAGLMLEKQMAKEWSLRTGLLYTKTRFSYVHAPTFEFGESMPGMHGFDHDFQYSLLTPSAKATLTLRVEQADTTVQIPNDENIELRVGADQEFRYLSIPIGLSWRKQWGRFGLGLSTDFIGNLLLGSAMQVSSIEVLHPDFRVHQQGSPSFGKLEDIASFNVELATAASFSVLLKPGLRLQAGPAMRFQLSDSSTGSQNGSKGTSVGLEGALMCRF